MIDVVHKHYIVYFDCISAWMIIKIKFYSATEFAHATRNGSANSQENGRRYAVVWRMVKRNSGQVRRDAVAWRMGDTTHAHGHTFTLYCLCAL